jgi:hypothetical protein
LPWTLLAIMVGGLGPGCQYLRMVIAVAACERRSRASRGWRCSGADT